MPRFPLRTDIVISAAADLIVGFALLFLWHPGDALWQWAKYGIAAALVAHALWEVKRGLIAAAPKPPS